MSGVSGPCQASVYGSHVPLALWRVTSPGLVLKVTVPCAWGEPMTEGLALVLMCPPARCPVHRLMQRSHLRLKWVQLYQPSGLGDLSAVPYPVPMAITFIIATAPLDWLLAVASMFVASALCIGTVFILQVSHKGDESLIQVVEW